MADTNDGVKELTAIMQKLRSEDGCPWDREQNHQTLKQYLREETAELLDAIDDEDDDAMVEELGDVLLQVVFHAQIAHEEGRFSLDTVAKKCCEKLQRRHPHVFGDSNVSSAVEVLEKWEAIKSREKLANKKNPQSVLSGVPRQLSALHRAYKVQKKASSVGFDWPDVQPVCKKIEEELNEVTEALAEQDNRKISEEIGDLLFAVTNLSRFTGENPEYLLDQTVRKFERRFHRMEELMRESGSDAIGAATHDLATLDQYWEQAKAEEEMNSYRGKQ